MACEAFLLLGGVLYWFCRLKGCDRLKIVFLNYCIGVLTFESPTQEFRIGLCVFVRFGLVTLVDCLFTFPNFHHVGGFGCNDMVLLLVCQSCIGLFLHVV